MLDNYISFIIPIALGAMMLVLIPFELKQGIAGGKYASYVYKDKHPVGFWAVITIQALLALVLLIFPILHLFAL
jgi:hypothetical protein